MAEILHHLLSNDHGEWQAILVFVNEQWTFVRCWFCATCAAWRDRVRERGVACHREPSA